MQKLENVRQSAAVNAGRNACRDGDLRASAAKRNASQSTAAGTCSRQRSMSAGNGSGFPTKAMRRSTDGEIRMRGSTGVWNMGGTSKEWNVSRQRVGMGRMFRWRPVRVHYGR
jgi:hypothetical protein